MSAVCLKTTKSWYGSIRKVQRLASEDFKDFHVPRSFVVRFTHCNALPILCRQSNIMGVSEWVPNCCIPCHCVGCGDKILPLWRRLANIRTNTAFFKLTQRMIWMNDCVNISMNWQQLFQRSMDIGTWMGGDFRSSWGTYIFELSPYSSVIRDILVLEKSGRLVSMFVWPLRPRLQC